MCPILALNIMHEFPDEIIDELNEHIDESIIPNSESFAPGLVNPNSRMMCKVCTAIFRLTLKLVNS